MNTATIEMGNTVASSLHAIVGRVHAIDRRREANADELLRMTERVEWLDGMGQLAESSKLYLERAVDLVYRQSVGELEEKVNQALSFVFFDRKFRFRIAIDDQRGTKHVNFVLYDGQADTEVDLKDGTGAGVRTVVSILLHVHYLLARRLEPVLFVDEGYAFLAEEYVDRFFELIKAISRAHEFALVIISHDRRFTEVADAEYRMDTGVLTKVK